MSAQFFGLAASGTQIIAIKDDLRLTGILLRDFEGMAGALSAVQIGRVEVLAGQFPGNIDQITLNSNGWDIYREGVDELPPIPSPGIYDELIEALELFKLGAARADKDEHPQWLTSSHDEIKAGPSSKVFSRDELDRLNQLGWYIDSAVGTGFYYFT